MTAPANFITFLGGSVFRNGRKTIQVIVTVTNIMNRFIAFFKCKSCTISGEVVCISFTVSPSKERGLFLLSRRFRLLYFDTNASSSRNIDIVNRISGISI